MAVDTSGATIIVKGTRITGKIELECKLHVDGIVDGSVHSSSAVTVGAAGRIEGEVFADRLVVTGTLEGRVRCESVEILEGGRIVGDIAANQLVIETNGFFEGHSTPKAHSETKRAACAEGDERQEVVLLQEVTRNR